MARRAQNTRWQKYIGYLMWNFRGRRLDSAAIVDLNNGDVLAKKEDTFPSVTAEQLQDIINEIKEPGSQIQESFRLAGDEYRMAQGEPGEIIRGKTNDGDGVIIHKASEVLLIGIYKYPMAAWEANAIVEWIADYISSVY